MAAPLYVERIGFNTWKYTAAGDGPFEWFHKGRLVGFTTDVEFIYEYEASTAVNLEYRDTSTTQLSELLYHKLQQNASVVWRGVLGVLEYRLYVKKGDAARYLAKRVAGGEVRYYREMLSFSEEWYDAIIEIDVVNMLGDVIQTLEVDISWVGEAALPSEDISMTATALHQVTVEEI